MPELPKFDDEDLKSYGDEEEESALYVFFPHVFLWWFSVSLKCVTQADICSRVVICQEVIKDKKWHGYDSRVINNGNIQYNWFSLPLCWDWKLFCNCFLGTVTRVSATFMLYIVKSWQLFTGLLYSECVQLHRKFSFLNLQNWPECFIQLESDKVTSLKKEYGNWFKRIVINYLSPMVNTFFYYGAAKGFLIQCQSPNPAHSVVRRSSVQLLLCWCDLTKKERKQTSCPWCRLNQVSHRPLSD